MKKEKKHIYLDERNKHFLVYLSLLLAAVFIGLYSPNSLWLSIGLGAGIVISLFFDLINAIKARKTQKDENLSTEKPEAVEKSSRDSDEQ